MLKIFWLSLYFISSWFKLSNMISSSLNYLLINWVLLLLLKIFLFVKSYSFFSLSYITLWFFYWFALWFKFLPKALLLSFMSRSLGKSSNCNWDKTDYEDGNFYILVKYLVFKFLVFILFLFHSYILIF